MPAEKSWPNQEWRYQFFFESEECGEEPDAENCEDISESDA